MTATVWFPALITALTTAAIVVSASAIAEALGPFWGAFIASLPVSAGPAYVFLSMRHREEFVAASALSSLAANAATGSLLIVLTQQVTWTPLTALSVNLILYGAGLALPSTVGRADLVSASPAQRRWFDHPVRAVMVAGFVSLIVAVSSLPGPNATGVAAVFPVSLISLIAIVRSRLGASAASLLAANALRSMLGFGMALLALHLAIQPWRTATALVIALLVSASWSGALLLFGTRQRPG